MGLFSRKPKKVVPDPRYDYHYGNRVTGYAENNVPFIQFRHGDIPRTPGAMIFGNVSERLVVRAMIGSGVGQNMQLRTLYNVFPIRQNAGLAAITGLGGVVHGQVALQPLSDPYNSEPY